ncbi:MAG: hypothetical protein ABI627_12580 [Polyangiaceae bacterium]
MSNTPLEFIMFKVFLCSVVLLSAACSSSASDGGSAGASAGGGASGAAQGGAAPTAGEPGTSGAGAAGASVTQGGATGVGGATATAGASGAGTAGASGTAGAAPTGMNESVTQRGADTARTSHWLAPTLTKNNVKTKMALDANFKANFDGELTGSPVFLAGPTPGTGRFFAATTENDVYALDELTGAQKGLHNIGGYLVSAPICGSDPVNHGIVSTPIIDAATQTIYVAAAMTDAHHEIHALKWAAGAGTAMDTLTEVAGWPVDVSTLKSGSLSFPSKVQNQRSALSLVNGILYVAFGGYCGDAGNYHGWVVGVNVTDPTKTGAWATRDARQAGIWAAGGLPSDGTGVFAVTGNTSLQGDHTGSDSEEVLRITDLGTPHYDAANLFYPSEWASPMNSNDQDFGSASPAVVSVPGAKPSTIVVAPAKPGRVYFLDAANLGGSLGQFADMAIADTTSSSVYTSPAAYQAPSGVYVALATGAGSQCPNDTNNGSVMSILLKPMTPGTAPVPSKAWCARIGGGDTPKRAPIATNSAGSADPVVWYLNGAALNAYDGEDGTVLYDSSKGATPSSCAGVHKFTSLMAVNGRIVAGGDSGGKGHLCSWSVH